MLRNYNTFDAASWLLSESDEEEELDTEIEETPEDDSSDDSEEETEEDEGDTDTEEIDMQDNDETDDLVDADDLKDTGIEGRLDDIENKLDDLIDKKEKEPAGDEYYDLDLSNPVCPHCGARLNIVDDTAETNDIDDQIIDGDFDTEDETDVESEEDDDDGETTGEDISIMDDDQDTTQDLNVGDDDYVNFDEIMASIEDDDDKKEI